MLTTIHNTIIVVDYDEDTHVFWTGRGWTSFIGQARHFDAQDVPSEMDYIREYAPLLPDLDLSKCRAVAQFVL